MPYLKDEEVYERLHDMKEKEEKRTGRKVSVETFVEVTEKNGKERQKQKWRVRFTDDGSYKEDKK